MMQTAYMDEKTARQRQAWKWILFLSLLPGIVYLVTLFLTFGFQLNQPGAWIVETFSHVPYPINFLLVAGSPIISIIARLTLKLPPATLTKRTEPFDITLWVIALLCLITMCPFPWLWLAFID